jgi:tetratricopeptide (TPR) repeat protein
LTLAVAVAREYRVATSIPALFFFVRGNSYHNHGDDDRAIQDYNRAIRLDPTFGAALANRGRAYYYIDEYDRSIQDYDQAIRLEPNNDFAFNGRGNAYSDKGEYDRSIQDYDQAIRFNPNYAIAFDNRGLSYYEKNEFDRAIQDYDQAIRLDPNYALAFLNRGSAYDDKGEYDRAIQDYDQAIRLNTNYAWAFNLRGIAYRQKGEDDRAIRNYDQALRLAPNYNAAFDNRGNAYRDQGEYVRAIQDYDRAILLEPKDDFAFDSRAIVRFLQGDMAAAVPDFEKSAELGPGDGFPAILLYVVKRRAGQNADAVLLAVAKPDLASWPGPIVSLLLGKTGSDALLKAARNPNAATERRRLCEAHFYLAEHELLARHRKAAAAEFQASINTCRPSSDLDVLARAEQRRLTMPSNESDAKHPTALITPQPNDGSIEGNTYANSFFQFSLPFPDGWRVLSRDSDPEAKDGATVYVLLMAGSLDRQRHGARWITIVAARPASHSGSMTAEDYLRRQAYAIKLGSPIAFLMGETPIRAEKPTEISIDGRRLARLDLTTQLNVQGNNYSARVSELAIIERGYLVMFVFSDPSGSESNHEAAAQTINSLHFFGQTN